MTFDSRDHGKNPEQTLTSKANVCILYSFGNQALLSAVSRARASRDLNQLSCFGLFVGILVCLPDFGLVSRCLVCLNT